MIQISQRASAASCSVAVCSRVVGRVCRVTPEKSLVKDVVKVSKPKVLLYQD